MLELCTLVFLYSECLLQVLLLNDSVFKATPVINPLPLHLGYTVKAMGIDQIKGSENVTSAAILSPRSENSTLVQMEEDKQVIPKDLFNRRDLLQLVTSIDFFMMYIMLMGNSITGLLIISRLSNMVQVSGPILYLPVSTSSCHLLIPIIRKAIVW